MQAIILAAGFGSRLKPLTDHLPKALVLCDGRPMLDYTISYLARAGFTRIIINVHYLGDLIINHILKHDYPGLEIAISDERDEIKETGGALVKALPYIDPATPLLIFNTDVITNLDLKKLMQFHKDHHNRATLVVQNRESNRKLIFNEHNLLIGWINQSSGEVIGSRGGTHTEKLLAFSGIHVIEPELIYNFKENYGDNPFPVIPGYLAGAETCQIGSYLADSNIIWMETGSPERLVQAESYLRNNK